MQRRLFLKSAGAVTVLVVAGGVWRACDQGVFSVGAGPAFEPWKDWQESKNSPLALVRAAILAASPHNPQPWLFKVGDSSIDLYLAPRRFPGALDPYLREEHIEMGCALENLMLAATTNGYKASATLFPAQLLSASSYADPELVARVALAPGPKQQSELYDAIPRRHTNRSPYDLRPLPTDFVEAIQNVASDETDVKAFVFAETADCNRIVDMISTANDIVYADPQVEQGSSPWVRLQWSYVQKFRDGLILDEFDESPSTVAIRKFTGVQLGRFAVKHRLLRVESYAELLRATPLFGVIAVRDRYDRAQSLRTGRIWQRTHLLATARGVAGRPVNEVVELIDHQRWQKQEPQAQAALFDLIGDKTWQPTFRFRLGYPVRQVSPSPRRPVNDVRL